MNITNSTVAPSSLPLWTVQSATIFFSLKRDYAVLWFSVVFALLVLAHSAYIRKGAWPLTRVWTVCKFCIQNFILIFLSYDIF